MRKRIFKIIISTTLMIAMSIQGSIVGHAEGTATQKYEKNINSESKYSEAEESMTGLEIEVDEPVGGWKPAEVHALKEDIEIDAEYVYGGSSSKKKAFSKNIDDVFIT